MLNYKILMIIIRLLLFPFSIIYNLITSIRNFFYDTKIFTSYQYNLPIIAVGNLSVGGTGKTPQIEYLIRLLSEKYKIATLSRGYKRKSKGFILADEKSSAENIGDEPFQFFKKFSKIQVAVDENRKNGIDQLLQLNNNLEIILLDDAYQHRRVKAGFYILLTTYTDLYCHDFILPAGNLRESKANANRANIIIVTKCPKEISEAKQTEIRKLLHLKTHQQLFFSFIDYDTKIYSETDELFISEIKNQSKTLVAGIAKPESFFNYLHNDGDEVLVFSDHHVFSEKDIKNISLKAKNNRIITTEKDYVRLLKKFPANQLYYLPIKSTFVTDKVTFDQTILNYVESSSRNG